MKTELIDAINRLNTLANHCAGMADAAGHAIIGIEKVKEMCRDVTTVKEAQSSRSVGQLKTEAIEQCLEQAYKLLGPLKYNEARDELAAIKSLAAGEEARPRVPDRPMDEMKFCDLVGEVSDICIPASGGTMSQEEFAWILKRVLWEMGQGEHPPMRGPCGGGQERSGE